MWLERTHNSRERERENLISISSRVVRCWKEREGKREEGMDQLVAAVDESQ